MLANYSHFMVGWLWAKHHISSGPSANRNSHAVPSGQGAAMPRATPGNRTRMAESRGKELTPRPECSPLQGVPIHKKMCTGGAQERLRQKEVKCAVT